MNKQKYIKIGLQISLVVFVAVVFGAAEDDPIYGPLTFSGRLTDKGKPLEGPVDLSFKFYRAEEGGESAGVPSILLPNTILKEGVFQERNRDLLEESYSQTLWILK